MEPLNNFQAKKRKRILKKRNKQERTDVGIKKISGKLVQYPSKRPLRILALLKVAEDFEKERTYTEKEVNEVIRKNITFSDHERIRREMYQYKIMNRLPNGSQYWLEEEKPEFKF